MWSMADREIEPLKVDDFGNITNWPKDFFGDEIGDLAAMTEAAHEASQEVVNGMVVIDTNVPIAASERSAPSFRRMRLSLVRRRSWTSCRISGASARRWRTNHSGIPTESLVIRAAGVG